MESGDFTVWTLHFDDNLERAYNMTCVHPRHCKSSAAHFHFQDHTNNIYMLSLRGIFLSGKQRQLKRLFANRTGTDVTRWWSNHILTNAFSSLYYCSFPGVHRRAGLCKHCCSRWVYTNKSCHPLSHLVILMLQISIKKMRLWPQNLELDQLPIGDLNHL